MIDVDISQNKGISEKRLSKKKYLDILKLYTSKDFNARFSLDKIKKSWYYFASLLINSLYRTEAEILLSQCIISSFISTYYVIFPFKKSFVRRCFCPSDRPSVCPSVRLSVRLLYIVYVNFFSFSKERPSVRPSTYNILLMLALSICSFSTIHLICATQGLRFQAANLISTYKKNNIRLNSWSQADRKGWPPPPTVRVLSFLRNKLTYFDLFYHLEKDQTGSEGGLAKDFFRVFFEPLPLSECITV